MSLIRANPEFKISNVIICFVILFPFTSIPARPADRRVTTGIRSIKEYQMFGAAGGLTLSFERVNSAKKSAVVSGQNRRVLAGIGLDLSGVKSELESCAGALFWRANECLDEAGNRI